ncbi:MAG: hypothetical protein LV479_09715 [Methylacidiphilales bacterium]|nr:hypothetical protein [Candidatus Methylacidiphilales bacterium]
MKSIILHPDAAIREIIRTQLEHLHHVVVHEDTNIAQILVAVAKYRPHFVVAEDPEQIHRGRIVTLFEALSLRVPILWYPPGFIGAAGEGWLTAEISRLLEGSSAHGFAHYSGESRSVLRDLGYAPFEDGAKRNFPAFGDASSLGLAREMAAFAQQVECALTHHATARRYLRQCLLTDRGLRREVAYRAVHSSHKIYWLREHVFRLVGVLSHYLNGVEPAYLPPPAPPSPKLDFLHHTSIAENYYAATSLLMQGIKPSWMSPLRSVLNMKFTGQDEAALLEETLTLAGWSLLLREIAIAQVRVMECALRPEQPWYSTGLPSRALHRATQTFCDFWDLRQLRTNPEHLRLIADGIVVDGVRSPRALSVVPPFGHYVETRTNNSSQT